MKLIPLGISGYLPINGRHSSCFLVLFDDAAFLLDAGTGAARMHEPAIREHLEGVRELHVLLSHYHVDHTAGLYYAFTVRSIERMVIHAPVCPFIQADPEEAIRRYFSPPLNSYTLDTTQLVIEPVNGPEKTIAGHTVRFWAQKHPGGSVGIRIDNALAYVTDTVVMEENAGHLQDLDLLMHELWLNEEDAAKDEHENNRHACFGPVAAFVAKVKPARMMPVHLYPGYDDAALSAMIGELERRSGVPVIMPQEGVPAASAGGS